MSDRSCREKRDCWTLIICTDSKAEADNARYFHYRKLRYSTCTVDYFNGAASICGSDNPKYGELLSERFGGENKLTQAITNRLLALSCFSLIQLAGSVISTLGLLGRNGF